VAGAIGGRVYVAGGLGLGSGGLTEVYDPVANAWSTAADLPFDRWVGADGVVADRYLVVAGGSTGDETASDWVLAYDAVNDVWQTQAAFLPRAVYGAEGDVDSSGSFWVVSGHLSGSAYSRYTTRLDGCPGCPAVSGAEFTFDPPAPFAGEEVTFTGSVAGGVPPVAYAWDFGDGGSAVGQVVTHAFAAGGTFTVTMTASNCAGASTAVASHDVTATPRADLGLAATDHSDHFLPGDAFRYTFTVTNGGPQGAEGTVLSVTLPAGVTLTSTSGCAEDPAGVPTCTLGAVGSGASRQADVFVTVNADTSGLLAARAAVACATLDPNGANDAADVVTRVELPGGLVFRHGFESGTTAGWSGAVP
jgi:uncharacterized repeat protein (TIGR01451 family)